MATKQGDLSLLKEPVAQELLRSASETVDGETPEYPAMAQKYLGDEAEGWRKQYQQMFPRLVRIVVQPEWVGIIDIPSGRFPSAIERAAAAGQ
jgi:hypothetical protein